MKRHTISFCIFFSFVSNVILHQSVFASSQPFNIKAEQAILLDYHTNTVLFDKNMHEKMTPSSMTKIMTIYLLFQALKNKSVTLDDTFYVSKKAWRQGGSRMFIEVDTDVPVRELILGTIVSSGNDASVAIAEGLAGSVSFFAQNMTNVAKTLGAENSNFKNPNGWPNKEHYSSAYDLAMIASQTIRNFPEYYKEFYHHTKYTYNKITQYSHNALLKDKGTYKTDGFKTGHTNAGGYGLVFSAVNEDTRLIGVVNGLKKGDDRLEASRQLLKWGFNSYKTQKLFTKEEALINLPVELGKKGMISVGVDEDVYINTKKNFQQKTRVIIEPIQLQAPIRKGDPVALLKIEGDYLTKPIEQQLIAREDVQRTNVFKRLLRKMMTYIGLEVPKPALNFAEKELKDTLNI